MKIKDISGQRFGRLVVVKVVGQSVCGSYIWLCRCDCGVEKPLIGSVLRNGVTQSCGCLQRDIASCQFKDITGECFGRLTVIRRTKKKYQRQWLWECVCTCGKVIEVVGSGLRNGSRTSCGDTHTLDCPHCGIHHIAGRCTNTPEYVSYTGAKQRCTNPNASGYERYGGRGIDFRFNSFEEWYAELGEKPEPKYLYSVDRFPDNDGNYEVGNVRWANDEMQRNNQGIPKRRQSGFSHGSGLKGVTPHGKRWQAVIAIDGDRKYLGSFISKVEAAKVYDAKAIELFGPYACTNESLGLLESTCP